MAAFRIIAVPKVGTDTVYGWYVERYGGLDQREVDSPLSKWQAQAEVEKLLARDGDRHT